MLTKVQKHAAATRKPHIRMVEKLFRGTLGAFFVVVVVVVCLFVCLFGGFGGLAEVVWVLCLFFLCGCFRGLSVVALCVSVCVCE